MRRVVHALILSVSGFVATGVTSSRALAQDPADNEDQRSGGGNPSPGPEGDSEPAAPSPAKEEPAPAAPAVKAPAVVTGSDADAAKKPKMGDTTVSGYFRGGFGGTLQRAGTPPPKGSPDGTPGSPGVGGRMTCFALPNPAGLVSKYRLGNECEVWSETHFTTVVYAGNDGVTAHMHFMPTVYIPTTYIGYSPTGLTSSAAQYTTSTGATVSFPNLYLDIENIPWLFGGKAWAGTRYYKRESVYISDFFYWNPSGVGGGIEDVHLNKDLRLSYAVFAVDGEPTSQDPNPSTPPLPLQVDLGTRHDVQLRGIKPYKSGEFQVGFQGIADHSHHEDVNAQPVKVTHSGWGVTLQFVQELLGGDNKLAFQYGRGGGTGFGTLSRFYYPDFSIYFAPAEFRIRAVDVLTIQPVEWLGGQAAFVYQHDDLGNKGQKTDWISAGARITWAPLKNAKLIGEVGYDHVKKSNGSDPQMLTKLTIAPALTTDRRFTGRPEIRLFYTYAMWNEAARTASIDSGSIYRNTKFLSGATMGLQGETWW